MVFLPGSACLAARLTVRGPEPVTPRRFLYQFDFSHPGRVHVSLETSSPASGSELLCLPSRWAEATELQRAIVDLKITGSEVSLEPTNRPSRLKLHAKPGTTMRLDYDLIQDWTGPFRASERHRVLLRPELAEFNGENGLVTPRMESGAAVEASFRFTNLPARYSVVTSFGAGDQQAMSGAWSEVANALFVAGVLSTRQISVGGGPVLLATAGSFPFSEKELAQKAQQILRTERSFWGTAAPAWYAIVLTPLAAGTTDGGGSAFTNAVSLSLPSGEHLGAEAESLLAHEAFHAWNPTMLGQSEEAGNLGWFIEGFTTFYQNVMLERSGLLDHSGYLKRVNVILRNYLTSPGPVMMANGVSHPSLDDEEARYREPYLRGAVIAMWLDGEIVRQSGGRSTLDDLMRGLLSDKEQPLTPERVFRAADSLVDAGTVRQLEEFANETTTVPVPNAMPGCTRLVQRQVWTFSLGVPVSEISSGTLLHGVEEDSAAHRAGLRDGQTLLAWSFWYGDPDHEATMTVREADRAAGSVQIRYLPRGKEVSIPQAEAVSGCTAMLQGDAQSAAARP